MELELKTDTKFAQPKRPLKKETIDLIRPKLDEYISAGIFEKATCGTEKYMSNLNAVSKPTATDFLFGRADKELRKIKNVVINKDRLVLDYRDLNSNIAPAPKVKLPDSTNLRGLVKDSYASCLDIYGMFNAMVLSMNSRQYTNFHNPLDHLCPLRCARLPQGCCNSPFLSCCATRSTFTNEKYRKWCSENNLEPGKNGTPELIEEFLVVYIDDIL